MGHYYFHQDGERLFIKMKGLMKYTSSLGFDTFIRTHLTGDIQSVLLDIQEADYIDSTNLGLIARIAEHLTRNGKERLLILSTNESINEVLSSMGFDQAATIIHSSDKTPDLSEVPVKTGKEKELLELMLDAHRKLVSLNSENQDVFQDVIELMEQELDS